MPRIPLVSGLEGSEKLPRTRRALQNCFKNAKGRIIAFPGITQLATTSKVARGSFEWNGSLYMVVSQSLIKITDATTGAFSTIGTIAGSQPIETDVGFNDAVIVVKGGAIYTLDKTDTLATISGNANFVACVDVTHIDGRFVYIPESGDPAFFSDVGAAGTVQAASFFDAEELPDKNNGCFNFSNTLFITGTDSMELFRNTGASPVPFARIRGSRISNGYIGGLLEHDDTFLFLGRKKDQDFGIFAISQGKAVKISNAAIELILSTYTQSELAEAISGRINWRGDDIATFTLRRDSFGFFGGNWFKLDTLLSGVSRPWAGGYITQFGGKYYTAYDDKIGVIADVNTDYGERITRIIDFVFEQEDGATFTVQSIELGLSQGFNAALGSVALLLSRDNVLYGPELFRNVGLIGEYAAKLLYAPAGGLGSYDGFLGVRFYTTEDIFFSVDFISVKIA